MSVVFLLRMYIEKVSVKPSFTLIHTEGHALIKKERNKAVFYIALFFSILTSYN